MEGYAENKYKKCISTNQWLQIVSEVTYLMLRALTPLMRSCVVVWDSSYSNFNFINTDSIPYSRCSIDVQYSELPLV